MLKDLTITPNLKNSLLNCMFLGGVILCSTSMVGYGLELRIIVVLCIHVN